MLKIIDDKVYHDNEKLGWIEGSHVKNASGEKIGHVEGQFIFNEHEHKVAYTHENDLVFENGGHPVPLQTINEAVEGTLPLMMKCAVYVLLEDLILVIYTGLQISPRHYDGDKGYGYTSDSG